MTQGHGAARGPAPTPLFVGNVEPFIANGLTLIPLHEWNALGRKGRPIGKAPRDRAWQTREYDSASVVESATAVGHNVGVRIPADWAVLDVDPRNFPEGRDALAELVARFALDLSACPHTVTGSGGHHYWFRKPADARLLDSLEDFPGVEFKSAGRQVVAPGSVHPEGRRYEWDDLSPPLADAPAMPAALVDAARRPERTGAMGEGAGEVQPEQLARTLEQLEPTEFRDHDNWLELMMACHYATDGEARQEFIDWSTADPKYAEDDWVIGNRWDSLHSDREGAVTTATLVKILKDRGKYIAPPDAASDFDDGYVHEQEPKKERRPRWELMRPSEIKSMPPPRWLVEDLLQEQTPAVIYGPPASGKSFLALDIALSIALGRPWHGRRVQQGGVLYIAAEGARGIGKRLRAWELHHGAAVADGLFALMRSDLTLADAKEAEAFTRFVVESTERLALIVVDTLSQTAAGAEEQSNSDMAAYMKRVQALVNATGASVLVVHHSGKDLSKGERGAYAIRGNVDTSIEVTRPDKGRTVTLDTKKQKDADEGSPLELGLMVVRLPDRGLDGEELSSLVVVPIKADAAEEFTDGEPAATGDILELARQLTRATGKVGISKLAKAASGPGRSESTARREVENLIPEGRINAVQVEDVWLWCEKGGKHKTAPVYVHSEPKK